MLRKAPTTGADVVVFDLEDGVHPKDTAAARVTVGEAIAETTAPCELCVRVNPEGISADADLAAVLDRGIPDAVVVPKVEAVDDVETVVSLCTERGADLPVFALVETAAGILSVDRIAAFEPVTAVVFGAEDLAADIGATRSDDGSEILYARQRVVLASAAADVDAIDTLVTDYKNDTVVQADAETARRFGFDGKIAIHPRQVPLINDAFTPPPQEIEWARRVLEAVDAADDAAVVAVDGEMIDAPHVTRAKQILDRARAAGVTEE